MKIQYVIFLFFPAAPGLLALAAFRQENQRPAQSGADLQGFNLKASIARGTDVYLSYCLSCHGEQGAGIENVYPPWPNRIT